MPLFNFTKDYAAGAELKEDQLNDLKSSIESAFNSTGLDSVNIQPASITASSKFSSDNPIQSASFGSNSVNGSKLQDGSVTGAKVAADAIATTNILAANVTNIKMAPLNYNITGTISTGQKFNAISSPFLIGSINITTSGRPVRILMVPSASAFTTINNSGIRYNGGNGDTSGRYLVVSLKLGSNFIGDQTIQVTTPESSVCNMNIPVSCVSFVDTPAAGSYTYSIYSGFNTAGASGIKYYYINGRILAYEL